MHADCCGASDKLAHCKMALKRRRGKKKWISAMLLFTRIGTAACPWGSPCCSQQAGKRWCLHSSCGSERFLPLEHKRKRTNKKKKACQCVPCVVFNSSLIAPDNTIKSKTILKRHGRNWNALLLPPETVVGLTGCKKKKKKEFKTKLGGNVIAQITHSGVLKPRGLT